MGLETSLIFYDGIDLPCFATFPLLESEDGKKILRVYLKYGANNEAAIRDLSRVSRPGCRVYVGRDEIKRVQGGLGISIMTTPRGVMTGRQARRERVGGEILCEVW